MANDGLTLAAFDFRNSDTAAYAAATAFFNRMNAERLPDDPPHTLEENIAGWRSIPDFVQIEAWGVRRNADQTIVAAGSVDHLLTGQNEHAVEFAVEVLPEYRRQGLGTLLLRQIVEVTQRRRRTLMISNTDDRIPAGALCVERLGARKGIENHTNQLRINALNHALVERWLAEGKANAGEFELGFWDGAYPDADLPQVLRVFDVMNTMPRDALELEDTHFTAEHVRQMDESRKARGITHWTYFVRERASGNVVGFSDVYWHPARPAILSQGNTGVFPEYRNRGIGRWLKAAMLDRVLREKPEVQFVRTSNADSNAPMLKINFELGFEPYMSQTIWQVETETVARYLEERELLRKNQAQ
jgi:GNAT superfamily N-acetyltransferase